MSEARDSTRRRLSAMVRASRVAVVVAVAPGLYGCDYVTAPIRCSDESADMLVRDLAGSAGWQRVAGVWRLVVTIRSSFAGGLTFSEAVTVTGGTVSSVSHDRGLVVEILPDDGVTELQITGDGICDGARPTAPWTALVTLPSAYDSADTADTADTASNAIKVTFK